MIVYKDMTFCEFHETCRHGNTCHRAFTREHRQNAQGANLIVSLFAERPECYEEAGQSVSSET